MNLEKIGIIGQGFVGSAIRDGFLARSDIQVETFDLEKESTAISTTALVQLSDIIFVCVPTPMADDGSCNISIVDSVLSLIATEASRLGENKIAVIKSTCTPGSTKKWNEKYNPQGLSIIFNPEFLTARTAQEDFMNSDRVILGGDRRATSVVAELYRHIFDCPIIETDSVTAETVKYVTNTFFTLKVMYFNELYELCDKMDIDYDETVGIACLDWRIASSHITVPGPDGQLGVGGACLPKDLNAFIAFAKTKEVELSLLEAASKKNDEVRDKKGAPKGPILPSSSARKSI